MTKPKRYLVLRFDITNLTPNQRTALEVEAVVQAEASNDHPDVSVRVTYEEDWNTPC